MVGEKTIKCQDFVLKQLFENKFKVDFYQREYVWQTKQIEDLIIDLSTEFLKSWSPKDDFEKILKYNPYFMGEIILSSKDGSYLAVIDGQQRITSLTLLLIYLLNTYSNISGFPSDDVRRLIYSNHLGKKKFNLDIEERNQCMLSLFDEGTYSVSKSDSPSVRNIVGRYSDFQECWNPEINETNVVHFTYWLMEKVTFSQVITNNDEFAYVIFETMNDRGLSLTQTEMLRSYLLAHIVDDRKETVMKQLDNAIDSLNKLRTKPNMDLEFFKLYFRSHLAEGSSQKKDSSSDFQQIGKGIHRWVKDNSDRLGLTDSDSYEDFISKICFFSDVFIKIHNILVSRNTKDYLYAVVNDDYDFTLQPEPILASISYGDEDGIIDEKIKIVSKYLCKVISWYVWKQKSTAQSYLEGPVYDLSKILRDKTIDQLNAILSQEPMELPELDNVPFLHQQNKKKFKVLISLITEIVARASNDSDYMLNRYNIEIEHIWSDHFEQHLDEFTQKNDFDLARNTIGDLLVLPKSFNDSYSDNPYESKIVHYYEQNILAQTLCAQKYENNPDFLKFKKESGLPFKSYDSFKKNAIMERTELYKQILLWNWKIQPSTKVTLESYSTEN